MPSLLRATLLSALLLLAGCTPQSEFVPLFNGNDLSGWKNVNGAESTWTVRDDMIVCSGFPTGVMCSERPYENFVLELEWRHVTEGGNAGLFIHSDPLPARGRPFTRSIEFQVMDGNHGDVFAIHGATMVPDRPHPQGWMRSLPTEERANPTGEWNHYRVESRDGEVSLAVNGKVVSGGSEVNPRKGYICLESEGAEVHFRGLRINELPSTDPTPNETAEVHQGFETLYSGVDLSGWSPEPASDSAWRADDWILRSEVNGGGATRAAEQTVIGGTDDRGHDDEIEASTIPHLWTENEFRDFILIADWAMECDTVGKNRAGILLRGSPEAEVLIGCESAPSSAPAALSVVADDGSSERGWHRIEITVRGNRLSTRLNGRMVADERFPSGVPALGPIGLANHGTSVQFANLFIKELE